MADLKPWARGPRGSSVQHVAVVTRISGHAYALLEALEVQLVHEAWSIPG